MHSIILLTTFMTAVLANPLSSDNQRLVKRATCQANGAVVTPSPTGAGPLPTPSDPTNWKAYSGFSSAATNAALPAGYKRSFANLKASINDDDYLTYWPLDAYSTAECAKYCNAEVKCKGFNIYFERDPINSCPNPPPTTFIKCALYGGPISQDEATNTGELNQSFRVVIAGSNGYNKK